MSVCQFGCVPANMPWTQITTILTSQFQTFDGSLFYYSALACYSISFPRLGLAWVNWTGHAHSETKIHTDHPHTRRNESHKPALSIPITYVFISHFHVKHSHVCYVIGSTSQQQRGRERLHSDYSLQFYWVAEMWQSMTSTYDMEKPKTAQFSLSWLSLPNNEPKVIRFIFFTLSLFRLHRSPNAKVLQWKMYKQQQFI